MIFKDDDSYMFRLSFLSHLQFVNLYVISKHTTVYVKEFLYLKGVSVLF